MKTVLQGRIVTMDSHSTLLANGAIYIDDNTIVAVSAHDAPAPAGFSDATTVKIKGTIFPGFIELHNHLSYDSLRMWTVPKKFTNRNQWQNNADYTSKVSAPMGVIASSKDGRLLAAVARYAETKCLLGGVTTSQGISLKGGNLRTTYRSAMRVVDDPGDKAFKSANTRIPDVDASSWTKFKKEVDHASCLLLHLSEGLDDKARAAFLALQHGRQWAIGPALAGIHCAALNADDFAVMAKHQGSIIWSPLSNLLLYGGTTDIKAARAAGVTIALGSDWSPSGSKNLLNELKAAKAASDALGIGLSDKDIVTMATSAPAKIVKWDKLVGSIAPKKRADFMVITAGVGADPYSSLIHAKESDVLLVMIDGRAVVGTRALMKALGAKGESIKVGRHARVIDYGAGDPRIPAVTCKEAHAALVDALGRLPTLLKDENAGHGVNSHALIASAQPKLQLALDEIHDEGMALRPRLMLGDQRTGPDAELHPAATAVPLKPLKIDPPSVVDDPHYAAVLQAQMNIPAGVKAQLKTFYV